MASAYIALYMFFAGAGGGAFLFGALVDFILRVRDVRWLTRVSVVTDAGLVAGPFLVAIGCGFLVLDLGMPDRLLNVFLFPKMSILGIGSWSLALFVATSLGAYALGKIADRGILRWLEILLQAAALVLSVVIMVYSGLYLAMYPSVPLLYTGWTPVLFMASSLVLGLAVLMVIGFVRQEHTGILEALIGLVPADIVLVCAEFVALVVFVAVRWAAGGMARDALSASCSGATTESCSGWASLRRARFCRWSSILAGCGVRSMEPAISFPAPAARWWEACASESGFCSWPCSSACSD